MTTGTMIEADGLAKVFLDFWRRPRVRAVEDLTFRIHGGEVFGLLGPNGSGKSTTLKMVLGLLRPTRGRLIVAGRPPGDVRAKARIGYLPEESYLYPYLTAEETLAFFGRLFDLRPAERRRRADELLEMIGLSHARRRLVGEFSKGMARRIGLAQALINDPDLVILDEPTSGLDPIGCRQVKDLIRTLAARGKTVVLSSHLLGDVEDVCDRIAILSNGRLAAAGRVADLLEQRDRCRLTLPPAPADVVERIRAVAAKETGQAPDVDHPRRSLEEFFIEVVRRSRAADPTAPGGAVEGGRTVADYLAADAGAPTESPPAEGRVAADERLRRWVEPPTDPPS